VRSNLTAEAGAAETGFVVKECALGTSTQDALAETPKPELNYVHLLNRLLPDDVIVTAWSPVPLDFNARFSAASRSYKCVTPIIQTARAGSFCC
jgi:tRNA U38,U39,U40 pseudouridine synthase TruA